MSIPVIPKAIFDPAHYLEAAGIPQKRLRLKAQQVLFTQGDAAHLIFYIESGRAKLTVVSKRGKEATVSLLGPGDFIGEECLASVAGLRTATATAVTACGAIRLDREEMLLLLHEQQGFSDAFLKFMLMRVVKTQEDLIDQLFNNSEKRLARTLLLMADFGKPGTPETMIPVITQEALANMIGTTRSRVSFFMNRFRKLGYINYNGRIHVYKSLLNIVLQDRLPEQNATRPVHLGAESKPARRKSRAKVV